MSETPEQHMLERINDITGYKVVVCNGEYYLKAGTSDAAMTLSKVIKNIYNIDTGYGRLQGSNNYSVRLPIESLTAQVVDDLEAQSELWKEHHKNKWRHKNPNELDTPTKGKTR